MCKWEVYVDTSRTKRVIKLSGKAVQGEHAKYICKRQEQYLMMGSQIGSLNGNLSSKISLPARQTIIESMFDLQMNEKEFHSKYNGFEAYFSDWFEEKCESAESEVGVKTLQEVVELIAYIRTATNKEKGIIKEKFRQSTSTTFSMQNISENLLNASLDLAARLYLMVSIGSLQNSLTPGRIINWEDGWTLNDKLHSTLWPKPQLSEQVKLPKSFTAANLERIAGIEVIWTSNLADHLSLTDDDTNAIFDSDLIDETTRTLGLLIPSTDSKSREWFRKKQKDLHLDPRAGIYGPLKASTRQIENFHFWKDRLIMLKQTFDDTEPESLSLFWYDDRKKVQWYNFWGTVLILFLTITFGLIQCIIGAVQAWAAVNSMPSSQPASNRSG